MNLNQIIYLDSISRTNSISDSAKELFVSQPSISKAIRLLEDELGFEILIRSKKGVTFTDKGKIVLDNAQAIVRHMGNISNLATASAKTGERLSFKIGICPPIAEAYSLEILSASESSGAELNYATEPSFSIIRDLRDGNLDVGVIMTYNSDRELFTDEINKSNLEVKTLYKGDVRFLVRHGHPLAGQTCPSIEEIQRYQYVTSGNSLIAERIRLFLESSGYSPKIKVVRDTALSIKYAHENDCLISIPQKLIEKMNLLDDFEIIDVPGLEWFSVWLLAYRKNYATINTMKSLNDYITETVTK